MNISFDNGILAFVGRSRESSWRVQLSEIAIIGEYTMGVWSEDDYWTVFVTWDECWFHVPVQAAGHTLVMNQLRRLLRSKLNENLNNSTTWAHRIMWPEAMIDEGLFDTTRLKVPWWRWIFQFSSTVEEIRLSRSVCQYIRTNRLLSK